jgi:aminoglycoside phosphotransferase (APT) family kinase protein
LGEDDRGILRRVLVRLAETESCWRAVELLCRAMPRVLVHGDFFGKNARIRHDRREPALLVLDWEAAGFGTPAEDIAELDMAIYANHVASAWPDVDFRTLEKLETVGVIFRYIGLVESTSEGLRYEWVERTVSDLELYETKLAEGLERVREWTS